MTGSGKTAAFGLPILQKLAEDPYGIYALVLTPTRELAFQIADQFRAFGKAINVRVSIIVGGMDMMKQALELTRKPHIVVATPGRLLDHLRSSAGVDFRKCRYLVLDEADRLLTGLFLEEVQAIIPHVSPQRQTLLFSATMSPDLDLVAKANMKTPYRYDANPTNTTVDTLRQKYMFMPASVKETYLIYVLQQFPDASIIVFAGRKRTCQFLWEMLRQLQIDSVTLHSAMSQMDRLHAVQQFKSNTKRILVCTDIASRGLDIPQVQLVVNYDIPNEFTDYVHRVGRTSRAGRGGLAVSLITQFDVDRIHRIEEAIGKKMDLFDSVEDDVLKDLSAVNKARHLANLALADSGFDAKVEKRSGGGQKRKAESQRPE
eukprot:TRINITY_DN8452_c0_g1_i1.p1 TRINITY_DN8452_c0_g1~~TRINITY_DN8452_c0_g1_i1.p1  ORF type:complete len:434 (+),score=93.38 TRINITY_DN8452_c0_g1_i1:182-1303(+)